MPQLCLISAERLQFLSRAHSLRPGASASAPRDGAALPEEPVPCAGDRRLKDGQTGCEVRAGSGAAGCGAGLCPALGQCLGQQVRSHPAVPLLLRGAVAGDAPGRRFLHGRLCGLRVTVALLLFCALGSVSLGGLECRGAAGFAIA